MAKKKMTNYCISGTLSSRWREGDEKAFAAAAVHFLLQYPQELVRDITADRIAENCMDVPEVEAYTKAEVTALSKLTIEATPVILDYNTGFFVLQVTGIPNLRALRRMWQLFNHYIKGLGRDSKTYKDVGMGEWQHLYWHCQVKDAKESVYEYAQG